MLNKATWMSVKESDFRVVDNNPEMDLIYLWLLPDKKKHSLRCLHDLMLLGY